MCRKNLWTGFAIALIAALTSPAVVAGIDRTVEIAPDNAYQTALADMIDAPDQTTFTRRVDQFLQLHKNDEQQLIPQLLLFAARHRENARTKTFVGRMLDQLNAPRERIVTALAPHLDQRDDTIRIMVKDLLAGYEDRSATRPPDFSAYRAIIEADVRAGREPQTSLVRFMFETDPGTALQAMVRACQLREPDEIKPILWAEHVVAELFWKRRYGFVERNAVDPAALRELETLSRHSRWWVRLYAAEIIETYPELGTPPVVKRLSDDADIRVRETMQPAQLMPGKGPGDPVRDRTP